MRALILCAGAGTRLRPLTQIMPKPLVEVAGIPMAVRQMRALARAGIEGFVINAASGADRLLGVLGDAERWGMSCRFSVEGCEADDALETKGGIAKALDYLTEKDDAFIVAAGDIVTDFAEGVLAHLVLVPNPDFHPNGDLALTDEGKLSMAGEKFTFASFGVYHKALFENVPVERAPLFPWLFDFVRAGRLTGELYKGRWANVGSVEELARAEALFAGEAS